jgi:hypothetical protein
MAREMGAIRNSEELRAFLLTLMSEIKTGKVELASAREVIKAAAQVNISLQSDLQAARLGLEMARAERDKLPLAIAPAKL